VIGWRFCLIDSSLDVPDDQCTRYLAPVAVAVHNGTRVDAPVKCFVALPPISTVSDGAFTVTSSAHSGARAPNATPGSRGLMPLFESGVSPAASPAQSRTSQPHRNLWLVLYSSAVLFALGGFIQARTAAVVITCQREAGQPLVSCVLDRRLLLDTVSMGSERVTGVQRARTSERNAYRRGSGKSMFAVVLETAEGERDAGWSMWPDGAIELTGSINQRIKAGTARFEAALHPHLFDWMLRLFGLFTSVVGLALTPVSVWLGRWRFLRQGTSASV
jgi:hypothetical protein